jgi:hypothetical protein
MEVTPRKDTRYRLYRGLGEPQGRSGLLPKISSRIKHATFWTKQFLTLTYILEIIYSEDIFILG